MAPAARLRADARGDDGGIQAEIPPVYMWNRDPDKNLVPPLPKAEAIPR
jgi:hypothetical protein